jgi:hypothetical protein
VEEAAEGRDLECNEGPATPRKLSISGGRSGCPLCVTLSKEREETHDKARLSFVAARMVYITPRKQIVLRR